jgi:hypothetical protein
MNFQQKVFPHFFDFIDLNFRFWIFEILNSSFRNSLNAYRFPPEIISCLWEGNEFSFLEENLTKGFPHNPVNSYFNL